MIARLAPIKVNINRYMANHSLRIRTLHPGHPTRALMSREWEVSDIPISDLNVQMPFRVGRRAKVRTPMRVFENLVRKSDERFFATASCCRPGDRLIDQDDERFTHMIVGMIMTST